MNVVGQPISRADGRVKVTGGGGFGGKGYVWPHTLLAALAARVLNRPVRLQLTRAQ